MVDYHRLRTDLFALALLAATVFVGMSLFSYDPADPPALDVYPPRLHTLNLCGVRGAEVAHVLRSSVGLGSYVILLAMVLWDIQLFARRPPAGAVAVVVGWSLVLLSVCVGLQLLVPDWGAGPVVGSGGYVGAWAVAFLAPQFSTGGTTILIVTGLVAGPLIAGDQIYFKLMAWLLFPLLQVVRWPWIIVCWMFGGLWRQSDKPPVEVVPPVQVEEPEIIAADVADDEPPDINHEESVEETFAEPDVVPDVVPSRKPLKVNPPMAVNPDRDAVIRRLESNSQLERHDEVPLPSVSILEQPEEFPYEELAKKAMLAAETLERTFKEFQLNVTVAEVDTGPVVTQFELELEAGLRVSKVSALADDLAIALRVPSVRVVSPIPGKNTVGVEVPNETQVMVRLRELIELDSKNLDKHRIPIFLGKDVSGRPLIVDLTKMPHLLIAGRTGTGKSVCLNTLILSILMTRTPSQVRLLMIDPKMVELSPYMRIPHLMHPVITDMKKAEAVLAWAVDKMEERYDLLARTGVRHLDGYNALGKEKVIERLGLDPDSEEAERIPEHMPYIVIVADEMADMMMTSGKDVEGHIIRLAQKSRAVGIHLVLATQKPTVDVITGLIKSNLPARISFQVASRVDSRVVLDEMGAERLLGNGDMLYLAPGTSTVTRAQGTYVSDSEVHTVVESFQDHEPQYSTELVQLGKATSTSGAAFESNGQRDDLYDRAVDIVIREGRGSVSLLQRCLGIGYGRAARLVDYMAEDGIVGDYNGSQAREVLYSPEQWEALKEGAELEDASV